MPMIGIVNNARVLASITSCPSRSPGTTSRLPLINFGPNERWSVALPHLMRRSLLSSVKRFQKRLMMCQNHLAAHLEAHRQFFGGNAERIRQDHEFLDALPGRYVAKDLRQAPLQKTANRRMAGERCIGKSVRRETGSGQRRTQVGPIRHD